MQNFEASDLANVILIKGNGKHFCAGGDVVCTSAFCAARGSSPVDTH